MTIWLADKAEAYAGRVVSEPPGLSSIDALKIDWIGCNLIRRDHPITQSDSFHTLRFIFRGTFAIAGKEGGFRELENPSVIYRRAGYTRAIRAPEPETPIYVRHLGFSGSWVEDWIRFGWLPARLYAGENRQGEAAIRFHHQMIRAIQKGHGELLDEAKLQFMDWIYRSRKTLTRSFELDHPEDRLRRLARSWKRNPPGEIDYHAVAASCQLSYSRFRDLFRQLFKTTPHEFVLQQRIALACTLIAERKLLFKAIAYRCGFERVETFNRNFQKVMGLSPTAYRARLP